MFRIKGVMSSPIRILLCDDQAVVRLRTRQMLKSARAFEVVGEADGGIVAVRMARELKPNLVLIDVQMPDLPGSVATRQILAQQPDIRVIAFSGEVQLNAAREMFAAGASGYVLKEGDWRQLLLAIDTVMGGGVFLTPGLKRAKI